MGIQFTPDDAVYYCNPFIDNFNLPPTITYGVIVKITPTRVCVRCADGRQRVVRPHSLLFAGYCATCEVPAIERDGRLICPTCNQPAIDEPAPDRLTLSWYGIGNDWHARVARECVLTGGSWIEGYHRVRVHDQDALIGMLKQVGLYEAWRRGEMWASDRMAGFAVLGDVAAFLRAVEAQTSKVIATPSPAHTAARAAA